MYSTKPRCGKFEGSRSQLMAEIVYNASLDGCNSSFGDIDGFGYVYSLVMGKKYAWILCEDSQGFVDLEDSGDRVTMEKSFRQLLKVHEKYETSEVTK